MGGLVCPGIVLWGQYGLRCRLTPDLSLAVPTPLTGFASRSTPNFVYLAGYLVASAACPKWYER